MSIHQHSDTCEDKMIYKISAKPLVAIEIEILFDNKDFKKIIISKNDLVQITYMDNETEDKKVLIGRVKECNENLISIDHSTLFESNVTKILIMDIRDIDKRHPEVMPLETK